MPTEPLFFTAEPEQEVVGPFDIVQLAALLREGKITAETLVFREGEEEWKRFGDRSQFIVASEMPVDAVSRRVDAVHAGKSRWVLPLPSAATGLRLLFATLVLGFIYGLTYYMAAAYPDSGLGVVAVAGGSFLFAECFIIVRLMDEPLYNRLLVGLVPLTDIYYFQSQFWNYLPAFTGKYLGLVMALGAGFGIANSPSLEAVPICNLAWHLANFF